MPDPKEKLKKLHTNLVKDGYDVPTFDLFQKDMSDAGKLSKLRENLVKEGYDLPDFNTFQIDMGFGEKKNQVVSTGGGKAGPSGAPLPSGGQLPTGLTPSKVKITEYKEPTPAINVGEDPVKAASVKVTDLSKLIQRQAKPTISTTAVKAAPIVQEEKSKERRVERAQSAKAKVELDKTVKAFKDDANLSTSFLMQSGKLKDPNEIDLLSNEQILQLADPSNETQKVAVNTLVDAKNARTAVKGARNLEEAAILYAGTTDPQVQRQIDISSQTVPTTLQETLTGTGKKAFDPNEMFAEATRGRMLYQFLSNPVAFQEISKNPALKQEVQNTLPLLIQKYPDFGKMYLGQKISQKMEDMGINNAILNIVTEKETDDAVNELVKEGKMTENEKNFYNQYLRGEGGFTDFGRKILGRQVYDTPGLVESTLGGAGTGVLSLGKGVSEITGLRKALVGEQKMVGRDIAERDLAVNVAPKGIINEITKYGGQFLGQSLSIGGGGKVLSAIKAIKNVPTAAAVVGGLQAYANYIPDARQRFPGDELKQRGYVTVLATLEAATENIFRDQKIVDGLLGKMKPEVGKVIQDFTAKKISAEAAKQTLTGQIKNALSKIPEAAKYYGKGVVENTAEEVAAQLGQQITSGVFENKPVDEWINGQELFDVARQSLLGSAFVAGLSARADMMKNRGISAKMIYGMAENPDYWSAKIQEAAALDPDIAAEAQDKLDNLAYVSKVYQDVQGQNMSEKQKIKYVINALDAKVKKAQADAITDPVLKKKAQAEASALEADQEALLDGTDDGSIEGDVSDRIVGEEVVPEVPATEITEQEYNDFVDNGVVAPERLEAIAQKVKNKEALSEREQAIFTDKTAEINTILSREEAAAKAAPQVPAAERKNWTEQQYKDEIKRLRQTEGNEQLVEELINELGQKAVADIEAAKGKAVRKVEEKAEVSNLQGAISKYEEGEIVTFDDLVNEVEAIADSENNQSLKDAVADYREEQRYNESLKGRGDMDAAEDAFLSKIRGVGEVTPKVAPQVPAASVEALKDVKSTAKALEGKKINAPSLWHEGFGPKTTGDAVYLESEKASKKISKKTNEYNYFIGNPYEVKSDKDFNTIQELIDEAYKKNPNAKWHPEVTKFINDNLREKGYDSIVIYPEALESELGYERIGGTYGDPQTVVFDKNKVVKSDNKSIAEAYHKAKSDGSNPQLVKAVEDLLVGEVTPEAAPEVPAAPVTPKAEPIRQLGTGANVYFENDKYRVNDYKDKTLLNVQGTGDTGVIANIEFDTPEEAVSVGKTLNRLYPQGVPEAVLLDKVVEDIKAGKYKEQIVGKEVVPQVPEAPVEELPFGETAPREIKETKQETNLKKRALNIEAENPRAEVLQYFLSGGKISPEAIANFFGKERRMGMGKIRVEERKSRTSLTNKTAPKSIDALAEKIAGTDRLDQIREFRDAIESVLLDHTGTSTMAEELVRDYDVDFAEQKRLSELEEMGKDIEEETKNIVSQIPEAQQEEILKVLDKFRDEQGFIDWRKIAEEYESGFEPVLLELSEPSQKIIEDAIKQIQETGRVSGISPEALPVTAKEEKGKETIKSEEYAIQEPAAGEVSVQPEAGVSKEVEGGVPPTEPKKVTKESKAESEKELDRLANNVPDTGKVAEYLSKGTIIKYTGEAPANEQARGIQELGIALEHGKKIIEKAKEVFGEDYVEKTLDYIENSTASVSNKALMYVSLENELVKEKLANPNRAGEITKQQALVYAQSQALARENSLSLNYQKLRQYAIKGYDRSIVTDQIYTSQELESKKDISSAIEASPEQVNQAAEDAEAEVEGAKLYTEQELEQKVEQGVRAEVDRLFKQLPKQGKTRAEKALDVLAKFKQKLRGRTYDATLGIPVAIIDAGITTIENAIKLGISIEKAIDLGIKKIKEGLRGKSWDKENDFREDMINAYKEAGIDTKAKTSPSTKKQIVKDALIKSGFGRTVTIKGQEREILDWKKLAGRAGTVENIQRNVENVLKEDGYSQEEINNSKDEFTKEYIDLRQSIIEKAQNELARRNKSTVSPKQKSAAKRLAELYTFGLFEQNRDEFDNLINSALGVQFDEKTFKEANKIAEAMENVYNQSFNGVRLNDLTGKSALENLNDKIRLLTVELSKKQGPWYFRAVNLLKGYMNFSQTMILNTLKNSTENLSSGAQQKLIDKLFLTIGKETTPELVKERRRLMKDIYKDMIVNGGIGYGKVENEFVNRRHIDDYVNKLSDKKLVQGIASVLTGKATLNAMDAMFKAGLTEARFTSNLVKILISPSNKNRMTKEEAVKFVSEQLTGQTIEDARVTAKDVIDKINKDAGQELIKPTKEQINRLANDIVKAALEMNGTITTEQMMAAYNAAYRSAGLSIGHESNNALTSQLRAWAANIESNINRSIKEKEWANATLWLLNSIFINNIVSPFVGGGTNWLVLKLEKTGLGLFTGLAYEASGKKELDLTTRTGLDQLERRLFTQSRAKDSYMRGAIGGLTSLLLYAGFMGIADEEEYRKWRGKNRWAVKYLDLITPEYLLASIAAKDKRLPQYVESSLLGKNEAFSITTKIVKSVNYAVKGDSPKTWGAVGETIGARLNAPLPWRLVRDGQILYDGIRGEDPYHGNYKPSVGFWSGVLQGGAIEWMGLRPMGKGKVQVAQFKVIDYQTEEERDATNEEIRQVENLSNILYKQYLPAYKSNTEDIWVAVGDKVKISKEGYSKKEVELWEEKSYNQLTKEQQDQLDELVQKKALKDAKIELDLKEKKE